MLPLPTAGFSRSVTKNNVNRSIMGDWLEASALFCGQSFSINDVVDVLVEEAIVDRSEADASDSEQDLAYGIAEEGWTEINDRIRHSGPSQAYDIAGKTVRSKASWQDDPIRSFLILLSLAPHYPKWAEACRAYGEQGLLFEKVSSRACSAMFQDWYVYEAGWSAAGPKTVDMIVNDLAGLLGISGCANPQNWVPPNAKDGGLDLICFRTFPDARECVPMFAIQCASGAGWTGKVYQPDTKEWKKWLDSAFEPTRAMIIPFVVDRADLPIMAQRVDGPLFDRNRLLSVGQGIQDWMADIKDELIAWCTPRVELLKDA